MQISYVNKHCIESASAIKIQTNHPRVKARNVSFLNIVKRHAIYMFALYGQVSFPIVRLTATRFGL